jgi:molecular chaperone DnaK (HSP70)
MAVIGVDFGTTNTVVCLHDRGTYPVVPHTIQTKIGRISHEVFPSTIYWSKKTGQVSYGLEAERLAQQQGPDDGFEIRSIKRLLGVYAEGLEVEGPVKLRVKDLLVGFLKALKQSILASGIFPANEPFEAYVTWPAHANGAQRAITRVAFREAGFTVHGSLNEPTAAAIEYADRATGGNPRAARTLTETVAVFDLGGGTFDASLLAIKKGVYQVLDTVGIEALGGDDLDRALAEMFVERLGKTLDDLPAARRAVLLGQARAQKEALGTRTTPTLFLDPRDIGLSGTPISVPAAKYLERVRPLVQPAVDRLAALVQRTIDRKLIASVDEIGAIYLVGGSSRLPLVQQMVSERFPGLKVISTHKPFSSIAVGAAISGSRKLDVKEIFSRHFGVVRLLEGGRREYFHTIFEAGTHLPAKGEEGIERVAQYSPRHNIGHLRFFECSEIGADGLPRGRVREWSEVMFPYDPGLDIQAEHAPSAVRAADELAGTRVEERYQCDADGIITVEVSRLADGKKRRFEIYRD